MLPHKLDMPFLAGGENRKSFFHRVSRFLVPSDARFQAIERAYLLSKDAFREVHRDGGDRYFEHNRRVTLIGMEYLHVRDFEIIIAALCHDMVEDKKEWTIARIREEFGRRVALLMDYLSKPSPEAFPDKAERERVYHWRLDNAPREVFLIKLPDRLDNLLGTDAWPKARRMKYVEETRRYHLPYAERHGILVRELEYAVTLAAEYENHS